MTPQEIARSIADELREHPEHWTQGAIARTSEGEELVSFMDKRAVYWCLEGLFYKHARGARFREFSKAIDLAMGRRVIPFLYNDNKDRTVTEIIALCNKVAALEVLS